MGNGFRVNRLRNDFLKITRNRLSNRERECDSIEKNEPDKNLRTIIFDRENPETAFERRIQFWSSIFQKLEWSSSLLAACDYLDSRTLKLVNSCEFVFR